MKVFPLMQALAVVAAVSALAPPVRAADECKAEVRATPRSDQESNETVTKVFAVEVDTQESCLKVYVDFIVTERLFNGEEITSTHRGWRKVSNHTITYKVSYPIARDSTIVDWKFVVARCAACGTE